MGIENNNKLYLKTVWPEIFLKIMFENCTFPNMYRIFQINRSIKQWLANNSEELVICR